MTKPFIVNKPARAVLVPAAYYPEIQSKIAKSKLINFKGRDLVAIHHGELETVTLRSLGFEVMSPLEVYYEWPKIKGEHKPFVHQEDSAGFLTLYPKTSPSSSYG